jgi:DNA repair exonuclease SbcCD nuclease subunit
MVKIIFLADTHLGFDFPLKPKKEKRRRGMDFFNNFDHILAYAKTNKADLVIHGGDLFYRTRVPIPIVDMVYERIFNFAETGIPMVIVPGNHESSRLPVSLFMQHPNIYYFTGPQVFGFSFNGINFDIAGFPCVRKDVKSKFPEIVKEIQANLGTESIRLLCMHQSIEGAKVGPSDFAFRYGQDVIPINDLPDDYDLILSGHIHREQILRSKNGAPIIYPGSIERTAFAEMDEEKGFYEINISEKREITYNFLPLKTRPMVDVLLENENYSAESLKRDILEKIKTFPEDVILRIKMKNLTNSNLLTVRLLDEVIPKTMNYQVSGVFTRNEI